MSTVRASSWKLPEELIALSEGTAWPTVLREWSLDYIEQLELGEESETCLCHHHPIREVCHIVNDKNENTAIVGNCCVKRFEGDTAFAGTHKIFDALKRIRNDRSASANTALIEYAYNNKVFNQDDYDFYIDIWRKKNLTDKQERYKLGLNNRLLTHVSRKKRDQNHDRVEAVAANSMQEAFNALRAGPTKLADTQLIDEAYKQNILNDKDHQFYTSLWERNVRNPSEKQQKWLNDLNDRMVKRLRVAN